MFDLEKLKSAEVIEDPEIIAEHLMKAKRQFTKTKDGEVKLKKATSLAAKQNDVPDRDNIKRLVEKRGMPWQEEYAERVVPYWMSDERVDSYGDIVRQSWDFSAFEKNSPMPYSHEWEKPTVGRIIDWAVRSRVEADYNGDALFGLGLFATKDMWEWADNIYRLTAARFLVAGSVGFMAGKIIDVTDDEEREEIGLGRYGFILDDNKLLEFSPTTLGANEGAITTLSAAKRKNMLQPADITLIRDLARREIAEGTRSKKELTERDSRIRTMAHILYPDQDFDIIADMDKSLLEDSHPEEDREVKGLVQVQKSIEDLSKTVDEFVVSMSQEIFDIRSMLENGDNDQRDNDDSQKIVTEPMLEKLEKFLNRHDS